MPKFEGRGKRTENLEDFLIIWREEGRYVGRRGVWERGVGNGNRWKIGGEKDEFNHLR